MDENNPKKSNTPPDENSPTKPTDIRPGTSKDDASASTSSFAGVSASPPAFLSIEQMLKTAEDVIKSEFNMTLAHEICVDKDFRLEKQIPQSGIGKQVKEIIHKAFWDVLEEKLSADPPDYSQAIILLKEIKEGLLECLSSTSGQMRNEINEILDVDLIKQQTEQGTLDVMSYANYIIVTMSRLCAPARDVDIEKLKQLTEVIPLYRGILETIDLMKLDMANFAILQLRPYIQQHSIEYEKEKFQEILTCYQGLTPPVDGLKFTREWLRNVYTVVLEECEEPTDALIMRKAYIKVLQWEEVDSLPETLYLDVARFLKLRDGLKMIIITASVLLVTYSNIGPSIQGISDFKETLKAHLLILLEDVRECSSDELHGKMEAVGLQVVEEVNKCLEEHGYTSLNKEKSDSLVAQICEINKQDHSVRLLIAKRVFEFLEQVLHTSSTLRVPPGLSALQNQLSQVAGQFLTLVRHNQAVFGDHYSKIIAEHRKHIY